MERLERETGEKEEREENRKTERDRQRKREEIEWDEIDKKRQRHRKTQWETEKDGVGGNVQVMWPGPYFACINGMKLSFCVCTCVMQIWFRILQCDRVMHPFLDNCDKQIIFVPHPLSQYQLVIALVPWGDKLNHALEVKLINISIGHKWKAEVGSWHIEYDIPKGRRPLSAYQK